MDENDLLDCSDGWHPALQDEGIVRTIGNNGLIWSSACTVRRTLKWVNKRNPHRVLNITRNRPLKAWRKAGMTSSQHGPYALGHTHPTMGV